MAPDRAAHDPGIPPEHEQRRHCHIGERAEQGGQPRRGEGDEYQGDQREHAHGRRGPADPAQPIPRQPPDSDAEAVAGQDQTACHGWLSQELRPLPYRVGHQRDQPARARWGAAEWRGSPSHISSAAAWQCASAGDWTSYAAGISHRITQGDRSMHNDRTATHGPSALSSERIAEVEEIISRVTRWAARHRDVAGLLLAGSYARNSARPDSDVDLVLLTTDQARYADNLWVHELAIGDLMRVQSWGAVIERRFRTASGLEVEINIGAPDWAGTEPLDPGTRRVVTDGARALHDPTGALGNLIHPCRPDDPASRQA
ncbi:nucleotidyltransferase domain-containing protein [Micromonospora sp. NPDC049044]|uniref:nucleotidyltransferase domain-containing protein n=1 Tax=unclassified Micromonospora TaxID=2617518 RepID=UPI0033EBB9C2